MSLPAAPSPDVRKHARRFNARIRAMMRPYWRWALAFSLAANLLLLVSPVYMLQVYDRVMVSGSFDTLIWLSAIAIFLLIVMIAADSGRRRVLNLAGARAEEELTELVFQKYDQSASAGIDADLARVGRVAQLFQGNTLSPIFDLPFAPLFVAVLFLVHPVLGWLGLGGSALILAVALLAEFATRAPSQQAGDARAEAGVLASVLNRQRTTVVGMGMGAALADRHARIRRQVEALSLKTTNAEGEYSALTKSLRQMLQIGMLGAGAALALSQEISAGAIVAGSIVLARAVGPLDQIVGGWRALSRGREAWRALKADLAPRSAPVAHTPLPRPEPVMTMDRLAIAPTQADRPLIHPFNLAIEGGGLVAIVGPIGSGKTTFLQTLAGVTRPFGGGVSLGAVNLHAWPHVDRGRYVGYVPQIAELFPGTVKENVARFLPVHDRDVFEALHAAGAAELALSLPNSLDTLVGPGGMALSSGQSQLIGLARALVVKPVLLLLDEPTANLDPNAAGRLIETLRQIARQGVIVVTATHDLRLLNAADTILSISGGALSRMTAAEFLSQGSPIRIATSNQPPGQAAGQGGERR
jgi:PrtD family type I secretion system ABC transporter